VAVVVGAGIEQALARNWTVKAEYPYVRFDGINARSGTADAIGDSANFANNTGHFASDIGRLSANYKFQSRI